MSAVLSERSHDRYELDDNGLTPMQLDFVRYAVRDCPGDLPKAAIMAGYAKDRVYQNVYDLKNNPKIQAAMRREQEQLHTENAPLAFHTLLELLKPTCGDNVRFQAAKDILDRCGYRPVEKLVIEHTLSPDERQARIKELEQMLGRAAQVVAEQQPQVIEGERVTETAQK